MSFALTTPQILAETKTVTRRVGWNRLKPGDLFWAVEKSQGLKSGQHPVYLKLLQCVSVRPETLSLLLAAPDYGSREMTLEGFPNMEPAQFISFFMSTHKGIIPSSIVNRIEFRYMG